MSKQSILPIFESKQLPIKEKKIRFDKVHPIKFPITEDDEQELRRFYLKYKSIFKINSMTVFCTMLMRYGLRNQKLILDVEYRDTKKYKYVHPNQIEYQLIAGPDGKAIEWCKSERQAVHRIVISVLIYLMRGGSLHYESVQQLRPNQ